MFNGAFKCWIFHLFVDTWEESRCRKRRGNESFLGKTGASARPGSSLCDGEPSGVQPLPTKMAPTVFPIHYWQWKRFYCFHWRPSKMHVGKLNNVSKQFPMLLYFFKNISCIRSLDYASVRECACVERWLFLPGSSASSKESWVDIERRNPRYPSWSIELLRSIKRSLRRS